MRHPLGGRGSGGGKEEREEREPSALLTRSNAFDGFALASMNRGQSPGLPPFRADPTIQAYKLTAPVICCPSLSMLLLL